MSKKDEHIQMIAGSIVLAAVIIGFSIIIDSSERPVVTQSDQAQQTERTIFDTIAPVHENAVRPVTEDDHIRGNENASITIIEYADLECPFCKMFHSTMQNVVASNGDVRWVYRHFPIPALHAKARTEALAAECAAALGGDDAFWMFTDRFFQLSPSNDGTDLDTVLPQIAQELDIPEDEFDACIREERFADRVDAERVEAQESGGQGTPWSIVIGPDGEMYGVEGARDSAYMNHLLNEIR